MIGDILDWYKAWRIIGGNKEDGWPECLAINEIAKLAFPSGVNEQRDFLDALRNSVQLGELPTTGTKEFRSPRYASNNIPVANLAMRHEWENDLMRLRLPDDVRDEPTISRQSFFTWEYRDRISPESPLPGWWKGIESFDRPQIALPHSISAVIPQVYVSYAWGNDTLEGKQRDEIVERLCEALSKSGFEVGRDKTHAKPGGSIKEFMKSLSKSAKIIAVISEKYLRSPNCMVYELYPAFCRCGFDRTEFREKVIALVLGDSVPLLKNPFDLKEYWQSECTRVRNELREKDPDRHSGIHWDFSNAMDDMYPKLPTMLDIINDTLMTRGYNEILITEFSEVIERLKSGNN
jgi:hypothetical protein